MATGLITSDYRIRPSDFVKFYGGFESVSGVDKSLATVDVKGSGDIEPMAYPVIWSSTDSAFVQYVSQNISTVTGSPLPDGSPIAFIVGDRRGFGFSMEDVTLSTTAVKMTALYRGSDVAVSYSKVQWNASTNAAQKAAFEKQMEIQGVIAKKAATSVTTTNLG